MSKTTGQRERGNGEKSADVSALVREFAPLVRKIARRYEGRGAERDDLEQEGYVALIEIARRFGTREMARRLKRHLPGYVRDAARRMWRHAGAVSLAEADEEEDSLAERLPDERAEQDVAAFELMDALERFLPSEEMALARALADDMTQEEIAGASGWSRATAGRRIANLRRRLCA